MTTRCASKSYLKWIVESEREWKGVPSVTQLLNGTRYTFLQITEEYSCVPTDRVWAFLGTGVSKILDTVKELMEWEGIRGLPDDIEENDEEQSSTIIDYKTSGSYKAAKVFGITVSKVPKYHENGDPIMYRGKQQYDSIPSRKPKSVDDWDYRMQLNMYKIMKDRLGIGHPVKKLMLQVMPRDGGTHIATSRGIDKNVYFEPIQIMPEDEVINYFFGKRDLLLHYLERNEAPPPCNALEAWDGNRCKKYCDVREHCEKIGCPYL